MSGIVKLPILLVKLISMMGKLFIALKWWLIASYVHAIKAIGKLYDENTLIFIISLVILFIIVVGFYNFGIKLSKKNNI